MPFMSKGRIASLSVAIVAAGLMVACGASNTGLPTSPSGGSPSPGLRAPSDMTVAVPGGPGFGTRSANDGLADDDGGYPTEPSPAPEEPSPAPEEPSPAPGEPSPAPTEPSPAPAPAPAPAPPPPPPPTTPPAPPLPPGSPGRPDPPTTSGPILAKVDPSPVPYSGVPVSDVAGCRILPHTWYYDQIVFSNVGSHTFKITQRENFFDGRYVSTVNEAFDIRENGSMRFKSRWCSGYATEHTAQTRFRGVDSDGNKVLFSGPVVRLMGKPK